MIRAIVFAMMVVMSGCAGHPLSVAPQVPVRDKCGAKPDTFLVGVARADITFPPGVATFGHAIDSRVTDGYWTRLYCRIFYIEAPDGQRMVIVPCDLPAMSALIQRQVLANLSNSDKCDALSPSELMLTATHTHAGYGHYFGAQTYTGAFSSRIPGYDEELMLELSRRISEAIKRARRSKVAARLAWNHTRDFCDLTRNRSLFAFQANSLPWPGSGCSGRADYRAIDSHLDVLAMYALDETHTKPLGPLGSISFYAMHPTVLSSYNTMLGADVAGVVSREVERHLRHQWCEWSGCTNGRDPLHGVINTNEGDISPIRSRGDVSEAVDVGEQTGAKVWQAHPCLTPTSCAPSSTVVDQVGMAYVEESLKGAKFTGRDGATRFVCNSAYLGSGAMAGASDHRTSLAAFAAFGTSPPVEYDTDECQSPKAPFLRYHGISNVFSNYPEVVPLAVARIGDTLVSFMPAEMTVTAGHRLNTAVLNAARRAPNAPNHAIIAGLSNEYIEYVTTPEEYGLQFYEGASTVFGPYTADYLAHRAALLSDTLFVSQCEADEKLTKWGLSRHPREIPFTFGPPVRKLNAALRPNNGPSEVRTCTISPGDAKTPPAICMAFRDGPPGLTRPTLSPWVRLVNNDDARSTVRLMMRNEDGDPAGYVDDRGTDFRTRVHDYVGGGWVWSTAFVPSKRTWDGLDATGHFRVRAGTQETMMFSKTALPALCSSKAARLCHETAIVKDWKGLMSQDHPDALGGVARDTRSEEAPDSD